MKKAICGFLLFFTFVTVCFAQQNDSNTDEKNGGNVILKAGTELSAQLEQTLDIEKLSSGDEFTMKIMADIEGGGIKISKGNELMGRVVRVKKVASDSEMSELSVFFDFIKDSDNYLRFKADILSVKPESSELKFAVSPVFKGATVISAKGKNLHLDEGSIFQVKLNEDLVKK